MIWMSDHASTLLLHRDAYVAAQNGSVGASAEPTPMQQD